MIIKTANALMIKYMTLSLMLVLKPPAPKNTMAGENDIKTKIIEMTQKTIRPALLFKVLILRINNKGIVIVIPEEKEKKEMIIFSLMNFLFLISFPFL